MICWCCRRPYEKTGAVLLAPPDEWDMNTPHEVDVKKFHLCRLCWDGLITWLAAFRNGRLL